MGVFSKKNQPELQVKRNSFDGSFQNNLTMKMGYLYPCMCQEVIGGDTFRIKPAFGLRFMPTAFPLQTKIKAHCDFFYVRNRNLWKNWKNYFTSMGPHDGFPKLSDSETLEQLKTGSLGDYLGLPSTIVGHDNVSVNAYPVTPVDLSSLEFPYYNYDLEINQTRFSNLTSNNQNPAIYPSFISFFDLTNLLNGDDQSKPYSFRVKDLKTFDIDGETYLKLPFTSLKDNFLLPYLQPHLNPALDKCYVVLSSLDDFVDAHTLRSSDYDYVDQHIRVIGSEIYLSYGFFDASGFGPDDLVILSFACVDDASSNPSKFSFKMSKMPQFSGTHTLYAADGVPNFFVTANDYEVTEYTDKYSVVPFNPSALPFRAYEQIYNSFYRDDRNNPLLVDGVFDPNRFIPNDKGGIDHTHYLLRKRNWEQDFLTTAMTSPQFGQAPLVGLTSTGVASFQLDDGSVVTSQLSTDKDGDTVVGFSTTSDPSVNNTLVKLASSGISINDLRGVNSLQRYLEAKMRIGLRYRDQMKSVYGVDIKEDVLDMPEFIGSVSQIVDVSQINQTSESTTDPLGSYAGQLSCVGGRSNGFQKYCDENGYIIGIISVVPVPSYSQLCPKHFLKVNDPLDYYAPQFGHIGFQPIKYDEVCPLQASVNGVPLKSTFGYQRAWYDYLSNVDQIHGQFRTTLNNFILCRVFNSVPSLNEDFLTVDPESMNAVFTVNEVGGKPVDTILGQVHFDITMMRPIPRFGIPKLE